MNPVTRRIFLKPSGYTEDQIRRLGELLSAAISRQKALADQSPYILAPTSKLIETEEAFEFTHEPARGLNISGLFDEQAPAHSFEDLNRACAALVYGLRAAHASGPTVHGGICPGVLVVDASGLWKLTDFGFAPAVLAALESDAFLQLAVGPSTAYPDASAVWEITPNPEDPRDERLWSFVDPHRYAQALQAGRRQPARFDLISDVISAGFVMYVLADKVHPYLKHIGAAEEFRNASYWEMLPTGRPRDIVRKDLLADPDSPLRDWWKNFVPKAIERKPEARKTIEELAVRLTEIAPPIDAEQMLAARRAAEAVRWIAALEAAVDRGDWVSVEQYLGEPPIFVPTEGKARVAAAREALDTHHRAQAETKRQKLELADWSAWLDSIQAHIDVEQWDPAAETLRQRRERGLAACPESLRSRWQALTATVRSAREERDRRQEIAARIERARSWIVEMRAAADAGDVGRLLALADAMPDTTGCEIALVEEVAGLALRAGDLRTAIAADHAAAHAWLTQAEVEAGARRWQAALAMLEKPPELVHPPADFAARIGRLRTAWQQRLAALGDERRAAAEKLVQDLVDECVRKRMAAFVPPDGFDAQVTATLQDEKDGLATTEVEFTVGWRRTAGPDPEPLGRFECTVGFDGAEPRLLSDAAEVTERLTSVLTDGIAQRQREALQHWINSLKGTFLGGATGRSTLDAPVQMLSVSLEWAEGQNSTSAAISLDWDTQALAWQTVRDAAVLTRIVAQAVSHAAADVIQALSQKVPAFDRLRALIEPSLPQPPPLNWDRLPQTLQFNTPVAIRPPGGQPEPLVTAQVSMPSPIRAEVTLAGRAIKGALEALLLKRRRASIEALSAEVQSHVQKTPVAISSSPDSRRANETATWVLIAPGVDPINLVAAWRDDALAFELPPEWRRALDEYAKREPAKPAPPKPEPATPTKESPPPTEKAISKPDKKAKLPAKPDAAGPAPDKILPGKSEARGPAKPALVNEPNALVEHSGLPSRPVPAPPIAIPSSGPKKRRQHFVFAVITAAAVLAGISIYVIAFKGVPWQPPKPQGPVDEYLAELKSLIHKDEEVDKQFPIVVSKLRNKPPKNEMNDSQLANYNNLLKEFASRSITDVKNLINNEGELLEKSSIDDRNEQIKQAQSVYDKWVPYNKTPDSNNKSDTEQEIDTEPKLELDINNELETLKKKIDCAKQKVLWESKSTLVDLFKVLLGNDWKDLYAPVIPEADVRSVALRCAPKAIALDFGKCPLPLGDLGELEVRFDTNGETLSHIADRPLFKSKLDDSSEQKLAVWLAKRIKSEIIDVKLSKGLIAESAQWRDSLQNDPPFKSIREGPTYAPKIQEIISQIPPSWKEEENDTSKNYGEYAISKRESDKDQNTGYPSTLNNKSRPDKPLFQLVTVFPKDSHYDDLVEKAVTALNNTERKLWEPDFNKGIISLAEKLGKPVNGPTPKPSLTPEDLGLRLFYIEIEGSKEWTGDDSMKPTLEEWFVAAAKIPEIRNGPKTWCQQNWACGSSSFEYPSPNNTTQPRKTYRVPPLPDSNNFDDIAKWLADAANCQLRAPSDVPPTGVVYRKVIRIWPRDKNPTTTATTTTTSTSTTP